MIKRSVQNKIQQLVMPVLLNFKTYEWLQQIGVFRNDPIRTTQKHVYEVPYDEEIYLQNGYLIGVTLRKFVKPYSEQYQQLLKVRKIALLKSSENWQIIEPYLLRIGCDSITALNENPLQTQVEISVDQLAEILQSLYEQYSTKEDQKIRKITRARKNFLDIHNFNSSKPYYEAENSLQLMCILLTKCFHIDLSSALGLLIDKQSNLKKLIIDGSQQDEFDSVRDFYEQATTAWPILQEMTTNNSNDLDKVLEALAEGVLSQSKDIIHSALNLLSFVKSEQWFMRVGYYKLLSSPYIQCFYFTIQRLSPDYKKLLNEDLHRKIQSKNQLLTILHNLLQILPRTIYSKQVLNFLPLPYFYEQCYSVLNVQEIDDQPPKLVRIAKDLIMKLIITYPDRIPHTFVNRIIQTFKYNPHRNYPYNLHNLSLLFQILEALMSKQSPLLQRFFKLTMKYLPSTQGETRYWLIDNLTHIYRKFSKYFPVGCMLGMYSLSPIGQPHEYSLFDSICDDQSSLEIEQCCLALNFIQNYIKYQLHCKCFINILHRFLGKHTKNSKVWCQQASINFLNRIQQLHVPILNHNEVNILNPKPPVKNKVVNSIGLKRKQMLKYQQFDLFKKLLQQLSVVKDKSFLINYSNAISHTVMSIEKQIGHKKKQLVNILKQLKRKIKKNINEIMHKPQPMSEIVKSILINRSRMTKQSHFEQSQLAGSLSESKILSYSQSRMVPEHDHDQKHVNYFEQGKNEVIEEQEDEENQFLDSAIINQKANELQEKLNTNRKYEEEMDFGIKDWTQNEVKKQNLFYGYDSLQQHEIAYINAIKDENSTLFQICAEILIQTLKSTNSRQQKALSFAKTLGISNLMTKQIIQPLYSYCESMNGTKNSQVTSYLLHSAINIFSFNQTRRVQITCLASLLTLVNQHLSKDPLYSERLQKNNRKGPFLRKHVRYQNSIRNALKQTNNLANKNKTISFSICFEVLSEIMFNGLGVHAIEPYSKQMNELIQNQKQKNKHSLSPPPNLAYESEIQKLQKILQTSPSVSIDYRIQKPVRKLKSTTNPIGQNKSIESVDSKQLRSKLAKRLQILNSEVNKMKQAKSENKIDKEEEQDGKGEVE